MTKKRMSTQDKMLKAFTDFNDKAYFEAKAGIKKMTPELKQTIERIEGHPTFGKSKVCHNKWAIQRTLQQQKQYDLEMQKDAVAGKHHKHASQYFGKTYYSKEYKALCKRLGINL